MGAACSRCWGCLGTCATCSSSNSAGGGGGGPDSSLEGTRGSLISPQEAAYGSASPCSSTASGRSGDNGSWDGRGGRRARNGGGRQSGTEKIPIRDSRLRANPPAASPVKSSSANLVTRGFGDAPSVAAAAAAAARQSSANERLRKYIRLAKLGSGSFADVTLERNSLTGALVAVKRVSKRIVQQRGFIEQASTERCVLEKLKHPFLVRMNEAFQNAEYLYLVLTYAPGGDLHAHLTNYNRGGAVPASPARRLPLSHIFFYAWELVLVLGYLHGRGYWYRDLKPENILLGRDGHLLLTDFGVSKRMNISSGQRSDTFVGTMQYIPPEVLENRPHSAAIDWWAFGVLLFEMVNGRRPFDGTEMQIMNKIVGGDVAIIDGVDFALQPADRLEVDQGTYTGVCGGHDGSSCAQECSAATSTPMLADQLENNGISAPTTTSATGLHLCDATCVEAAGLEIANEDAPLVALDDAMVQLRHLVASLLCRNPSDRLGSRHDSEEVLRHPFFTNKELLSTMRFTAPLDVKFTQDATIARVRQLFEEKKVAPVFVPHLESPDDVSYFPDAIRFAPLQKPLDTSAVGGSTYSPRGSAVSGASFAASNPSVTSVSNGELASSSSPGATPGLPPPPRRKMHPRVLGMQQETLHHPAHAQRLAICEAETANDSFLVTSFGIAPPSPPKDTSLKAVVALRKVHSDPSFSMPMPGRPLTYFPPAALTSYPVILEPPEEEATVGAAGGAALATGFEDWFAEGSSISPGQTLQAPQHHRVISTGHEDESDASLAQCGGGFEGMHFPNFTYMDSASNRLLGGS